MISSSDSAPNSNSLSTHLQDASDEYLLQRGHALDSLLSGCALHGIEPPDGEVAELEAVIEELQRRKLSFNEEKITTWTSWLGSKIDGFTLTGLLAQGRYSLIFKAESEEGLECVIKIARAPEDIFKDTSYATQALKVIPFQTGPVSPEADEVVRLQIERLQELRSPLIIPVVSNGTIENRTYYTMPLLSGFTLRQRLSQADMPVKEILTVFHALCFHLEKLKTENYHGDITPDNIYLQYHPEGEQLTGITLIDPGYFGPLQCREGYFETCMISTPDYSPLLEANDLLSVGICLWEAITGVNPFNPPVGDEESNTHSPLALDEDLLNLINFRESLLQPQLAPLKALLRPTHLRTEITASLEKLLFKALKLRLTDTGALGLADGFATFSALKEALQGEMSRV